MYCKPVVIKMVYNIEVENFQPAEKIIPNKNEGVFSLVKIFKSYLESFL